MTRRPARPGRAAFTLVELLIVVVIIALLAGLLLVAVNRFSGVGKTAQVTNDISNLTVACEKFKQEFGFLPPSVFRLPSMPAPSTNAALTPVQRAVEDASFQLLKQMYPRWNPPLTGTGMINWAAYSNMTGYMNQDMDGNQAMVLFLAGPIQTGWATDSPQAPAASATALKGPYFDFKSDRLDGTLGGPRHFLDSFTSQTAPNGTPYVYFGSNTPGGKYTAVTTSVATGNGTFTVNPFVETVSGAVVVKYVNQGGVQIISAGEDGKFGPGCPLVGAIQCRYVAGQSNPAGGLSPYGQGDPGADDLANFNNGDKLGTGR